MPDNGNAQLKTFCSEALTLLGAGVSEDGDGLLSVAIPPSMLDLFEGRPSLRLAFAPEHVDDGVDLVVPGSYVLERIIESVRSRGEVSAEVLDPVVQPSPAPGVGLANAEARLVSSESVLRDLLLASFRVSLVSDENQDRLFSVLIDLATGKQAGIEPADVLKLSGRKLPAGSAAPDDGLEAALAAAQDLAMDYARDWADSAHREIDGRLAREIARLDEYYRAMLADAAPKAGRAAMRKAERLREKAAVSCDELEQVYDIARRFIQNAPDRNALRAALSANTLELEKKRDSVAWKSIWVWSTDILGPASAELRKAKKAAEIALRVTRTGTPEEWLSALERDREQSLTDVRAQAEQAEVVGSDPAALAHLQDLSAQLDSEKARRIAELHDKFQLKAVVVPVSAALIRYPSARYSYSAISGPISIPFTSHQDLITGRLDGPECQSCHGPMASGLACACGHLACEACHKTCAGCGKDLCSSCVTGACQVCGGVVCERCRSTCRQCGKLTCPTHSATCAACGKRTCKGGEGSCGRVCAICGRDFCPDHTETCPACGSTVCGDEMRECAECGARACSRDIEDCPCCGKAVCPNHRTACELCGQMVCAGCVGGSGYCKTCEDLFPATSSVPAIAQILSTREANGGRQWLVSENRDAFVIIHRGPRMRAYTVDKRTGAVTAKRTLGLLASLRARSRLHR